MTKKRLLSGIQPSGTLHVGNYFGAMKQFVDMQEDYDTYVSIVNYHALTTVSDKEKLQRDTLDAVIDHLAVGLDPEKATIFLQSDIPEVTELTWIFNTLITVPFLERGVAYKDKVSQGINPTIGLFDYPVLMAADILVMDADIVPVGEDQKQHIEYARDIREKFHSVYGEVFNEPKILLKKDVATIPGTDGRKMSKSYGNTIPLFADKKTIEKAVMSIPTDSKEVNEAKEPEKDNVFALHKLFAGDRLSDIREGYEKGGLSYANSKKMLVEEINNFIEPLREKREEIAKDKKFVERVLRDGKEKAREIAVKKINEVREVVGIINT